MAETSFEHPFSLFIDRQADLLPSATPLGINMASNKGVLAITDKIEANPYGVDPIRLLEAEVFLLIEEVKAHKRMMKVKSKGPNIHTRLYRIKQQTLERLIGIHPQGEDFFLS